MLAAICRGGGLYCHWPPAAGSGTVHTPPRESGALLALPPEAGTVPAGRPGAIPQEESVWRVDKMSGGCRSFDAHKHYTYIHTYITYIHTLLLCLALSVSLFSLLSLSLSLPLSQSPVHPSLSLSLVATYVRMFVGMWYVGTWLRTYVCISCDVM